MQYNSYNMNIKQYPIQGQLHHTCNDTQYNSAQQFYKL